MDGGRPLFAKDPRLVAEQAFGGAGPGRPPGWRRRWVVLVGALAVLAVGLAGFGIHRVMAGRGKITIKTKPAGATVDIDGMKTFTDYPEDARWILDRREVTWSRPLTVRRQPGTYDIEVTVPGYVTRAARVVVQAGQTASLDIELQEITDMRLEIISVPGGRSVSLDWSVLMQEPDRFDAARTPFEVYRIREGEHHVQIDGDCHYLPWEKTVVLRPGTITKVEAMLERRLFRPKWCTEKEWNEK